MGALENVGQGIAHEAAVFLGGVHEALKIGEGAVGAAIAADEATRELLGEPAEVRSSEALNQVAESLFLIAARSSDILRSLVERGVVDESRLNQLAVPEALRLPSGDGDSAESTGENTATQEQQQGNLVGAESTAADPELSESRERQEAMLEDIFGEEKSEVIQGLTQLEMENFGKFVEALYLQVPIAPRGKPDQPVRAKQFSEYIAGTDLDEMAEKHDASINTITQNLKRAIKIMQRPENLLDLPSMFDAAIATMRPNSQS